MRVREALVAEGGPYRECVTVLKRMFDDLAKTKTKVRAEERGGWDELLAEQWFLFKSIGDSEEMLTWIAERINFWTTPIYLARQNGVPPPIPDITTCFLVK